MACRRWKLRLERKSEDKAHLDTLCHNFRHCLIRVWHCWVHNPNGASTQSFRSGHPNHKFSEAAQTSHHKPQRPRWQSLSHSLNHRTKQPQPTSLLLCYCQMRGIRSDFFVLVLFLVLCCSSALEQAVLRLLSRHCNRQLFKGQLIFHYINCINGGAIFGNCRIGWAGMKVSVCLASKDVMALTTNSELA